MTAGRPRHDVPEPELMLHLLGTPTCQRRGAAALELAHKDAALLARLALDGPQPRAAVCELMWPDSTAAQAAASLRQRSSRLRALVGVTVIEVGATVSLHADVQADVCMPEALPDDVLLARAGLLAGIDLGDHGDLDRWLGQARLTVAERCAQVLADRAEALEQSARLHEALTLARRIVDWVPLGEQGWRRLMRLHYLRGDRAAALDAYWRLQTRLSDELGTRPSLETQQLLQTIENAEARPALPRRPIPVSLIRPPVLVGRDGPWAAMVAAWHVLQPFLLVGEAGLGKSRLLEAFMHDQAGLVHERARPGDEQSTDALLGRLLVQIEQRFAPVCGDAWRAELARLRPEFGTRPVVPAGAGQVRHAIETWLLAALASGLRAIVVDDLHNADQSSLETLRWLSASPALAELRMGFATRPWSTDGADALLGAWLTDSRRPVHIALQPLGPRELSQLLSSLALPALLDAQIAAQLYRHAGGHPLYTLATLQHAVASGAGLQALHAMDPPDSVRALLDARVGSLPAPVRELLQVAAVGGADLGVERAARVLGTAPLALGDAWAVLEARDILRGEAFSHDLVHEAALRAVPIGVRQLLHRQWAEVLEQEGRVSAARLAAHWEAGRRWADAGRCWDAAARDARLVGGLDQQTALFERAARCHAEAGDRAARFESLLARLDGLQLRHGGAAVLDALPEIESLADTREQRLRLRIERTEALLAQGPGCAVDAVRQATEATAELEAGSDLQIDVRAQLAIALAQSQRPQDALVHARQAIEAARAIGQPQKLLRAANALMYVHWSAGRLADAAAVQREELAAAEALGDRALAAASEGSMAALLAAAGDVPGTYEHARGALERQRAIGLSDNSPQLILNHTVLGAAAAALGRLDEGLAALEQAVRLAGPDAATDASAKARLTLATLWLQLGRADEARATLDEMPNDTAVGMQLQRAWLLARAADQEGGTSGRPWARFEELDAANASLPLVQGVVFEASWRGDARRALERLAAARAACEALGLGGTARALMWRELVRWLDRPGDEATAAARVRAAVLEPLVNDGLGAKCYRPEVWLDLARAHERAGDPARRAACLVQGRRWLQAATARLAPALRHAFAIGNPVNRRLIEPPSAAR